MRSYLWFLRNPMLRLSVTSVVVFSLAVGGCGSGGGSSGPPPPPPTPDFAISLPATATLQQGTSTTVTVGLTGLNGFVSQVSFSVSGLPTGGTAAPSQFTLMPGGQQQVVLSASLTAAIATPTITIKGISGANQHAQQLKLSITAASNASNPGRVHYVSTDTLWDVSFLNFFPQSLILYHASTHRFFVSDTYLNRVIVIDARTETKVGEISVPGAFVADESPDHGTIYVGTQVGDLYEIDPVAMTVKARIPSVQIGPSGFQSYEVRALANGSLALLGGEGGIPAVDGFSAVGIWNPVTNALTIAGSSGVQAGCALQDHIVLFQLTADRSKILLGSGVSGGTLCMYDPTTGKQTVNETNSGGIGVGQVLTPADGKEILVAGGSQVVVYDASTLIPTDQFQVSSAGGFYRFFLSLDGSRLFAMGESGGPGQAFDWRTHTQLGWFDSFSLYDEPGTMGPVPMAVDETGLLACSIGHGLALLDTVALAAHQPGLLMGYGYNNVVQPSTGPVQGGTQALVTGIQDPAAVFNVLFGTQPSTVESNGSLGITVTTPPALPGPVDVTVIGSDGTFFLLPQDFSYGPSVVTVRTESSTADGGGTGTVYGYGFGPPTPGGQATGLQVSVGGLPASNIQFTPQPYEQSTPYYPFPMESIQYTLPPGASASQVDLTIATPEGSTTVAKAIQYLPGVKQFPLTGAALAQGIYDSRRDLYYFTDQSQIRVFSLSKQQWLSSIPIPGAQRLWGIALSPSGSKLAVSDAASSHIFTLNPDSPAVVSPFSLPNTLMDDGEQPCGLAITDANVVYYASFSTGFSGGWAFHKLNLGTGAVSDFQQLQEGNFGGDAYIRLLLTSDNQRVYGNMAGITFAIDTLTDTFFFNPILQFGADYELAVSSNQTWMTSAEYLMDTNLNPESFIVYRDRDLWNQSFVYGEKLSPDGNLLFSPLASAIDVIDGKQGYLRTRIALPFELSPNYDALVSDGKDNVLIAITGQYGGGIAVIDLSSLSEPIPQVTSHAAVSPDPQPMARWALHAPPQQLNNNRDVKSASRARSQENLRGVAVSPLLKTVLHQPE